MMSRVLKFLLDEKSLICVMCLEAQDAMQGSVVGCGCGIDLRHQHHPQKEAMRADQTDAIVQNIFKLGYYYLSLQMYRLRVVCDIDQTNVWRAL